MSYSIPVFVNRFSNSKTRRPVIFQLVLHFSYKSCPFFASDIPLSNFSNIKFISCVLHLCFQPSTSSASICWIMQMQLRGKLIIITWHRGSLNCAPNSPQLFIVLATVEVVCCRTKIIEKSKHRKLKFTASHESFFWLRHGTEGCSIMKHKALLDF